MNDYLQMANAIRLLTEHPGKCPSLQRLAERAGLSPFHFQRKFVHWVGISPASFARCLALDQARLSLRQGKNVEAAAYDTGLSGPGRLYDLCVTLEAASPGEIKSGGNGLVIRYGAGPTPFGGCLLAWTDRGVCYLGFMEGSDQRQALLDLRGVWPAARIVPDPRAAMDHIAEIFHLGRETRGRTTFHAYVKGTRFQLRVWRALLEVPEGALLSYGELAARIDQPSAARAVGSAVAANPIAYLIPCHRVIRQTGVTGSYRWGERRKKVMIACEAVRRSGTGDCDQPARNGRG